MNAPTYTDVLAARGRITGHVRRTPIITVDVPGISQPVTLKLEHLQVTGSFKARGAVNSMLQSDATDFIACSGGNHGLAIAWAAQRLGRHATIVVPVSAAPVKVTAMRAYGAEVIQHGDNPAEAFGLADTIVAERGWPLIHPYDQPATIAGQGTLGLELLEDAPDVAHWLAAVGGGGFPAGVALALDNRATLVPVEPDGCPSLFEAQRAGHPVPTAATGIARNSLGPPSLGTLAWDVLSTRVATSTLVTDEAIADAQRWLWHEVRIASEPGGACALAALLSGAWCPSGEEARLGVVICGANTDTLPE
jgi:threonine dehydratase